MRTNKLKKERPTMTSIPGNSKRLIVLIKFMSNIKILKWQKRKKNLFSTFLFEFIFYTNHSGSKILQNFHFKTFFAKAAKHSDCCKKKLKALNSL